MDSIGRLDELRTREDRRTFLLNLICFAACIEGLFFFGAFAYVYFLRSKGLLNGLAAGTNWVFRDESGHMDFAFAVVDTVRAEEPDLFDDELSRQIVAMMEEAVDAEMVFVQDMLSDGVPGLSVADTREYLQFVADQRLVRLGTARALRLQEPVRLHGAAGRAGAVELLRAHGVGLPGGRQRRRRLRRRVLTHPIPGGRDFHKQNRARALDFAPQNRNRRRPERWTFHRHGGRFVRRARGSTPHRPVGSNRCPVGRRLRARAYVDVDPADTARVEPLALGALVALGPGRYVNRVVGASLGELGDDEIDHCEAFFRDAGVPPSFEVCPWAGGEMIGRLAARGYVVEWFRNVFARVVEAGRGRRSLDEDSWSVRRVDDDDALAQWLRVRTAGFGIVSPDAVAYDRLHSLASHRVSGNVDIVASFDGAPAACGSLHAVDGVAWLGGAASVPEYRGRGGQAVLLAHRLDLAAACGCDLAAARRPSPPAPRPATCCARVPARVHRGRADARAVTVHTILGREIERARSILLVEIIKPAGCEHG